MFDRALALTMFSKLVCLLVKVETDDAEQTFNLYLFEYEGNLCELLVTWFHAFLSR